MNFQDAVVNGVPLLLVVLGLVQFAKKLGADGVVNVIVAMSVGLVMGVLYQVSLGVPTDFAGWFGAVVYGLGLGLVACGIYDIPAKFIEKMNNRGY